MRGIRLIVGILVFLFVVISVVVLHSIRSEGLSVPRVSICKTQMAWLVNDVLAFQMQNGFFPTSEQGLMALVEIPSGHPNPKIWKQLLKEVPLDPWGRPYILESPVTATPHGFQIRSHGANIDNEDDDIVVDDLAVKKKPRS